MRTNPPLTIIDRAQMCVDTRPSAIEGQGGNATTYSVAALLVWGFGLGVGEALPIMQRYSERCEPPWEERDLVRMLENALKRGGDKARGHLVGEGDYEKGVATYDAPPPRRVLKKDLLLEELKRAQEPALAMSYERWIEWLRRRSVVDPRTLSAEDYLDALYRPGERVLIFNKMWGTQGDYGRVIGERTMELAEMPKGKHKVITKLPPRSPEGMTFLMQPVDGKWHPVAKPGGKVELSRRSEQSVTRWPYLLLEGDKVDFALWLNVLVRFRIRIVSITASGGRSLHALVRLDKSTKQDLMRELDAGDARETLAVLGCDRQAAGNAMVAPRLPNTFREGKRVGKFEADGVTPMTKNGRRVMQFAPFRDGALKQALLYFNPAPVMGCSISEGVTFEHAE